MIKSTTKVIMSILKKIGDFNSKLILGLVYIIGIGMSAIIAKIFGKHFLDLKIEANKDTYWIVKESNEEDFTRSF